MQDHGCAQHSSMKHVRGAQPRGGANRLVGPGISVTGWCVGFIPHSWLCH